MKRRSFLKVMSGAALTASLPWYPRMNLFAADDGYTGPLWIMISANGGWDPTSFCDPKGYSSPNDPARINNYASSRIRRVGNFRVAPIPDTYYVNNDPGGSLKMTNGIPDATRYTAQTFFEKYGPRLLVVNGIDVKTNSHADARMTSWSGSRAPGYPAFGALVAASVAPTRPLSFITNGYYSYTAGLTTPTRLNAAATNTLFAMAYPNRITPQDPSSLPYFSDTTLNLIKTATKDRALRLEQEQGLARLRDSIRVFANAGTSTGDLQTLAQNLINSPAKAISDPMFGPDGANNSERAYSLYLQGRLALAAYQAGTAAAVNIDIGNFDTHGDHDAKHYPLLMDLLFGVDLILQEAASRGLTNNIVVTVGSDFGRTNKYNSRNGKDHWPLTSMMFIGNNSQIIKGNRIIGATTPDFKATTINPVTLAQDPNGVRITPASVHRALRRLAGIDNSHHAMAFPLDGQDLNLFG